jgi:hypothetical protein
LAQHLLFATHDILQEDLSGTWSSSWRCEKSKDGEINDVGGTNVLPLPLMPQ